MYVNPFSIGLSLFIATMATISAAWMIPTLPTTIIARANMKPDERKKASKKALEKMYQHNYL